MILDMANMTTFKIVPIYPLSDVKRIVNERYTKWRSKAFLRRAKTRISVIGDLLTAFEPVLKENESPSNFVAAIEGLEVVVQELGDRCDLYPDEAELISDVRELVDAVTVFESTWRLGG
jgi:hypothetical protein